MRRIFRTLAMVPVLVVTGALAFMLGASRTSPAQAAGPAVNACGCYRDSAGTCYCGKKGGKCVCPGECEPQGCEEKRAKELEKEVEAETKRAREAEKKQQEEEAARERKAAAPPSDDDGTEDDEAASANNKNGSDQGDDDKAHGKGKKSKKPKKTDKSKADE